MRQIVTNGLLSLGMLVVILSGGIDLSVGAVVALSGIVVGELQSSMPMPAGHRRWPSASPRLVGLVNGGIIARFEIAPFIVTLGTMSAVRGLVYVISETPGHALGSRLPDHRIGVPGPHPRHHRVHAGRVPADELPPQPDHPGPRHRRHRRQRGGRPAGGHQRPCPHRARLRHLRRCSQASPVSSWPRGWASRSRAWAPASSWMPSRPASSAARSWVAAAAASGARSWAW